MKAKTKVLLVILVCLAIVAVVIGFFVGKDVFLRRQYPLEYEDDIVAVARQYDLDPYLVCAVIDTESGFDPTAVSSAGAQGLMQLMPETAGWIAEKLEYTSYDIFDPVTNMQFGCWYLRFLDEKFDDNDVILAAYNAGHNRVAEWLSGEYSQDGATLTEIPYPETERYVKKVNKAYEAYQELYTLE